MKKANTMTSKAMLIFGTRPEAIKMAPVVRECLRRSDELETIVCRTGQHLEMLDQVTDYFQIESDVDLNVMSPNQSLATLTSRLIERLDEAIVTCLPDCIIAQGDTTSVMAASIVAFYHQIPFVHVEAGLRTHNLYSPWPEEFNRRVAGITAQVHCAPTEGSRDNLLSEGVDPKTIHVTGNSVIDALLWCVNKERSAGDRWWEKYQQLQHQKYVLITGHRRENFGSGFQEVCRAIRDLAENFSEHLFLYPVHLNPNVQRPVHDILGHSENILLQEPVPYPEFVWLMDHSHLILTDSGGVQEEAPSLKKPVLVTRETTERPEAVEAGGVELVGTLYENIMERMTMLLTDPDEYAKRQIARNPYGDGWASGRIIDQVQECCSS